jgi:S-(hydroxymethyl)glutathione dehydrogenase/alcohol dehydrogenase
VRDAVQARAVVLRSIGSAPRIEQVVLGPVGPGEVLVRLRASGLCQTDRESVQGRFRTPLPLVTGHEGAGVVEAVGDAVSTVAVGDHVVLSWSPSCGACWHCLRGERVLCDAVRAANDAGTLPNGAIRIGTAAGEPIHHFLGTSTHADYCIVAAEGAVPVPRELAFEEACLIGCAATTGITAATRLTPVAPGSCVAVVGCGAVGLNVIQGARLMHPASIVAIDPSQERLQRATEFGASVVVNPLSEPAEAVVRSMTSGRGADFTFEAAGTEEAFRSALELTRSGGSVVFLGKVDADAMVSLRFGALMGEKRLVRSSYGGAVPMRDFSTIAGLAMDGRVNLQGMVTSRITLEELAAQLADPSEGATGVRAVVVFDD